MKFNKLDKQKILIVSILVFVFLNLTVVYKPLKDKYQRQKNQLKIIKNLEKEKLEKKKDKIKEENIIISLESHFRANLNINYIKSIDKDKTKVAEIGITGVSNLLIERIKKLENISKEIYIEGMTMSKIEENNLECSMKLSIY
ncbi:Uncharacterised protein [[Clostridium] sordellii]|uniref:Uncharacterized protein n=1 Tax=Paraclostridium sordellii TaxID=1505 RepID=A0ABP1XSL9_PARSO|nr:hypothetical protein [Paeniclostridium sordellii]EPZ53883.1 hypothetical protein H477_4722 [[Clostridium] sordellii ATCC 9714] [Paeniclostridium sordellii ATCC 9714]MDU6114252.1 hypothetical protein [Paeniclostridium sordellii]CEJ72329.1 hypothetical protein ATCC9714_02171 [[Clostridium] sordellii] [Paeniclostridium sordellii]CEN70555.1 Uncharacterised protein [[Clostridium] sordellii] [Paeniclostridium sordellii]CEN73948.1 Uncharacterised protein [[Clostridium] sordellii] [Paeniclostridium